MSANDALTASPNITCSGAFTGSPLTYSAGVTAPFSTGTTLVTCWAQDAAGNRSPNQTFNAVVCAAGFAFTNGACRGECVTAK